MNRLEASGQRALAYARAAIEPTDTPRRTRAAAAVLGLAVALYAIAALVLTRDSIPQLDGFVWITDAVRGFSPSALAMPHNGHPLIPTRLLYTLTLRLFGPGSQLLEAATIVAVAATAVLLFALLKKRVDALLALIPAVLILFLGTTTTPLDPNIAVFAQSTALGLGAFLALERRDRPGDLFACGLLAVGVLTFTVGLAFAVGAAVYVAATPDRLRRAWIVVVPLVVFAAWYLWARKFGEGNATLTFGNLALAPSYAADSLAAGLAALAGLDREFVNPNGYGLIDLGWGRILAGALLAVSALAIARGRFSVRAWACVSVLGVYWVLGALAVGEGDRYPQSVRYVFVTAVLVVVVGYELLRNVRITRRITIVALGVLLFSLPINLDRMRYTGEIIRQVSDEEAAELTAIELQRDQLRPDTVLSADVTIPLLVSPLSYLTLADGHGSLATPVDELPAASGAARNNADLVLGSILMPTLVATSTPSPASCRRVGATDGDPLEVELPRGGAILRSARSAKVGLRRFADAPSIDAGSLVAGQPSTLELPPDASPQPWVASIDAAGPVEVCRLSR